MDIDIYNKKTMNIAYVAGLFDGDGSVWICKQKTTTHYPARFQMYINVVNTNKEICEILQRKFGGTLRATDYPKHKWKTRYGWYCASQKAKALLKSILPHLIIKKERVELALKFQKRKSNKKTKILAVLKRDWHGRITKTRGWIRKPEQYEFELACYEKMRKLNWRGKLPHDNKTKANYTYYRREVKNK